MRAFFRAVFVGTLAGAWMPLIITVLIGLGLLFDLLNGQGDAWAPLLVAMAPLMITFPIVLGSSVLIGLPTAWILRRLDFETKEAYLSVGIIAGSLVPLIILNLMEAEDGWWMALLGAFSGGMTAATWFSSTISENRER